MSQSLTPPPPVIRRDASQPSQPLPAPAFQTTTEVDEKLSHLSEPTDDSKSETGIQLYGDHIVVDWSGSNDPTNPRNWTNKRRWVITFFVSAFAFGAPFPSSMIAPGAEQVSIDFNITNPRLTSMVTSIFVLGFALGPLVLAPLSEIYGRASVFLFSNVFFLIWNTACGFAQSTSQIIAFRLLAGLGASAPLAIGGATLGDIWPPEQRGKAMAIYGLMPALGPVVGPIIGAWIAEKSTWRWIFWSSSLFQGSIVAAGSYLMAETFAPVLLRRKAQKVRLSLESGEKKEGVIGYYSTVPITEIQTIFDDKARDWRKVISTALVRPFVLFIYEPIVQVLGAYFAFVYGTLYLFLTIIPPTFKEVYGQSVGIAGLNYIALGIGVMIASTINAHYMDRIYIYLKKKHGQEGRPEFRLPSIVPGSILFPAGLLLTGWAAEKKLFWLVTDIGLGVFGMGMILNFQSIQIYVVDAFSIHSASALAAVSFFRSIAGFAFPLLSTMYDTLGYGKGNTVLAAVSIAIGCPAPWLLWYYGERLRKSSRFSRK